MAREVTKLKKEITLGTQRMQILRQKIGKIEHSLGIVPKISQEQQSVFGGYEGSSSLAVTIENQENRDLNLGRTNNPFAVGGNLSDNKFGVSMIEDFSIE